ncbi:hypothetical protein GGR50DRAFT_658058 [Xylaria sp. CBS 124048]|nr:hypothetical protein GGR50DRAFT_658058 [Xylaria sp. CBS 124048]
MPTPLTCQKCAAQIAKSTIKLPRSSRARVSLSAHTRAPPAGPTLPRHERGGPGYSRSLHSNALLKQKSHKSNGRPTGSAYPSSMTSTHKQDNSKSETKVHSKPKTKESTKNQARVYSRFKIRKITKDVAKVDSKPKKFKNIRKIRSRSKGRVASRPSPLKLIPIEFIQPILNVRDLKAKILASNRHSLHNYADFEAVYGLHHQPALQAVSQLRRLLRDVQWVPDRGKRLDQFLDWKKDFAITLRDITPLSSVGDDISSTYDDEIFAEMDPVMNRARLGRTAWQKLDSDTQKRLWPRMIHSAVESEPDTLPALIESTFDPSWCPNYVVEDTLYILSRRLGQLQVPEASESKRSQLQSDIISIGTFILSKCPPGYLGLEQTVILSIIAPLTTPEITHIYQLCISAKQHLSPSTLLHIASRYAKAPDTKVQALEVLCTLADFSEVDLNTPSAASVCTSLLTLNVHEPLPDERAEPDLIFKALLQRGFRPNLIHLSALMQNFCNRGRLDTAWEIFGLMLQYGIEPDLHVYSILLNGSKHAADMDFTEKVFEIIKLGNAWSPVIVNDFLDIVYRDNEGQRERRRRQRKKANNAWRPMVHLYAKYFDLEPLQKFTLFPLENLLRSWSVRPQYSTRATALVESLEPLPHDKLMQPDSTTLCRMVGAHMRSHITPKYTIQSYDNFFKLVEQKDATALRILADRRTFIHDIFIRSLMQFKTTIGFAIAQLQEMMDAAAKEKAELGRNLYHHPPTVYTWTVILNGLKNHKDVHGAVSVLNMMSRVGHVKPTLPTWNVLLQLFSRTHNVKAAVKAVLLLEKAGLQPDDRTIQAFSGFPKSMREEAVKQLEEMRAHPPEKTPNMSTSAERDTTPEAEPSASKTKKKRDDAAVLEDATQNLGPVAPSTIMELARIYGECDLREVAGSFRRIRRLERMQLLRTKAHLTGPAGHRFFGPNKRRS